MYMRPRFCLTLVVITRQLVTLCWYLINVSKIAGDKERLGDGSKLVYWQDSFSNLTKFENLEPSLTLLVSGAAKIQDLCMGCSLQSHGSDSYYALHQQRFMPSV